MSPEANTTPGDYDAWVEEIEKYSDVDEVYQAGCGTPEILTELEKATTDVKRCAKTLWLSGHGTAGVGISTKGRTSVQNRLNQDSPEEYMEMMRNALCEGATVWVCSCEAQPLKTKDNVQKFANRLGKRVRVCACTGNVVGTCTCKGEWICARGPKTGTKTGSTDAGLNDNLPAEEEKK